MRRFIVFLVDSFLWLLGKVGYAVFYLLGWKFICKVGRVAGDVIYSLNRRIREIIEVELDLLFGPKFTENRIKDITKRGVENYYMRLIEMILLGALDKESINKIVQVEGLENLDMALSKGKGVILLLSHFGSFLLPLPFLGYRGYKINQITGKQAHTSLIAERIWTWRRREAEKLPVKFLQADKFLRPVYKALKDNEVVAIAFDGRDGSIFRRVKILNRVALISPGPFDLAIKTGATIVPTFIARQADNTHRLMLAKPIETQKTSPFEEKVSDILTAYSHHFADYLLRYPSHSGVMLYIMKKNSLKAKTAPFFIEGSKEKEN